tara:strand:+ start:895 stop:1173 length:279 start_codon:yes stop_codon:yes gene_type:complete
MTEKIEAVQIETLTLQGTVSKHALLSPSGCERWSKCPASPTYSRNMPNKTSKAAFEGTVVHEIAEMELKGELEGVTLEDYWLGKEIEYETEE